MHSLARDENFHKAAGATGEELQRFAGKVAARFIRKGAPLHLLADPEDWEQTAALTVIEGVRSRRRRMTDRNYHFTAATVQVGLQISRAIAVVHIGGHHLNRAREFQDRVPLVGCSAGDPGVEFAASSAPDDRLRAAERRRALREVIAIVAWHVARMSRRDQIMLAPLLGLRSVDGGEEIGDVSWRTGIATQAIAAAIGRLRKRVEGDRAARRAWRQIKETP